MTFINDSGSNLLTTSIFFILSDCVLDAVAMGVDIVVTDADLVTVTVSTDVDWKMFDVCGIEKQL